MSNEPGRERHMIHFCEHCGLHCEDRELNEDVDEYWCPACIDNCRQNEAEAAHERMCEEFHDGGSTAPWPDRQRVLDEQVRKLK